MGEVRAHIGQVVDEAFFEDQELGHRMNQIAAGIQVARDAATVVLESSCYNPRLKSQPIWPRDALPPDLLAASEVLEAAWQSLLQEFRALSRSDLVENPEKLHDVHGGWHKRDLYYRTVTSSESCFASPETCAVLRDFEAALKSKLEVSLLAARYSVIHPGTFVRWHKSNSNQRLKFHLGLDIPAGAVFEMWGLGGNLSTSWENGRVLVLDDFYYHAVDMRDAAHSRLILEIEILHPSYFRGDERVHTCSSQSADSLDECAAAIDEHCPNADTFEDCRECALRNQGLLTGRCTLQSGHKVCNAKKLLLADCADAIAEVCPEADTFEVCRDCAMRSQGALGSRCIRRTALAVCNAMEGEEL